MKEEIYDLLLDVSTDEYMIEEMVVGLTWTFCKTESVGLAMSPVSWNDPSSRTLEWSGKLRGRRTSDLVSWIRDWSPYKASVGMAVINSLLNHSSDLINNAQILRPRGPANLAVFEHFRDQLHGKRVVVIGRYPGLDQCLAGIDYKVLERQPGQGDLPDTAAEYVIREADWVFLTSTSITNKTFTRLSELSQDANLVLMGPTTPWIGELAEFGVDYLAGVCVTNTDAVKTTISEGGGTRIFDTGVQYRVADLGAREMGWIETAISDTVVLREQIKSEMDSWYATHKRGYFPRKTELLTLDTELSKLDCQFKRLWDARH